jgi:hypothetical protein
VSKNLLLLLFLSSCGFANFLSSSISTSPVHSIGEHQRRAQDKRDYDKYYLEKEKKKKKKKSKNNDKLTPSKELN